MAARADPLGGPADQDPSDPSTLERGVPHQMLKADANRAMTNTVIKGVGAHLNYYGGPVILNAKIVKVLYGSGTYQSFVNGSGAHIWAGDAA